MELKNHRTTANGVAITHDRADFGCHIVGAPTLRSGAIMNGATRRPIGVIWTTWPPTPMGVIGAKIVPQFMGHNVEVPRIVGQRVVVAGIVHVSAEPESVVGTAYHVQVCNPAGACVGAFGHQMDQIPVRASQHWIRGAPFSAKLIEHGSRIFNRIRPWFRNFPDIDIRSLEGNQVIELVPVNLVDTRQHTQRPINGSVAIREGVVCVIVDVNPHFHTLWDQTPGRGNRRFLSNAMDFLIHGTGKGGWLLTLSNVEQHIGL